MKVFIVANEKGDVYNAVAEKFEVVEHITDCDVMITIGGDGTILRAGGAAAKHSKPLLGINMGRLGFMATLEPNELDKLERLKSGKYIISRRMLLSVVIDGKPHIVVNDVVLHREATSRLSEIAVCRNDTEVLKVRADGMIVATPTGSTAYSLSAGGPIIEPELECFLVTAICPHCLFCRPMVFTADSPITITTHDVSVSIDGCEVAKRSSVREITVTKSNCLLDLIDLDDNSFYNSIHNKLMKPLK
jgi:NAD+ kinase